MPTTDRAPTVRRVAAYAAFGLVALFGAMAAVALAGGSGPDIQPAVSLPRGSESLEPTPGPSQAPAAAPNASAAAGASPRPSAAASVSAASPTSPPVPTATSPAAAQPTATPTPRPPTATATTAPPTATPTVSAAPATISGFIRVAGGALCGGCQIRFSGPTTFDVIAGSAGAANGRFSGGASGQIPAGTYTVFYECRGNFILVNSPQPVTLSPGANTFDVTIGFCG